jgi:hypothetical protein
MELWEQEEKEKAHKKFEMHIVIKSLGKSIER